MPQNKAEDAASVLRYLFFYFVSRHAQVSVAERIDAANLDEVLAGLALICNRIGVDFETALEEGRIMST